MRLRGMAAEPAHDDVEAVGRRHDRTGPRARLAERQLRPVVQGVDRIAREAIEQALLDHHARAALAFLGRLEDEMHGAVEAPCARELLRRAEQHRGVAVVPAGVMHARVAARVWRAPELGDRQRVHVGAQADAARAAAVAQSAHHASAREAFVHLQPEQAQRRRDDARGAPLLEPQLRVRMQVPAQGHEPGHEVGNRRIKRPPRIRLRRAAGGAPLRVSAEGASGVVHSTASASWASVWKW